MKSRLEIRFLNEFVCWYERYRCVRAKHSVWNKTKRKLKKKVRKCVTFTERKQTSSYIQKDAGNICYGNLIWNYWCGCMTVGLIWRRRCSHTFTWVILVKIKKRESQTKCQTSKQYELIANFHTHISFSIFIHTSRSLLQR